MSEKITRRDFTKAGTAATFSLTAAQYTRAQGANEKVRLGVLGVANRGGQLITAFRKHDDCEIVALCDVDKNTLGKAAQRLDGRPDTYGDFRKLIERDDIDGVLVATPDHWHAIQTVDACDAGKDVYVEKPLSITVYEGRRMVAATRASCKSARSAVQARFMPRHVN